VWAALRDTYLLLRQFALPLLLFSLAVCGGGYLYYILSHTTSQPADSMIHGIYIVLTLTFLENVVDFPAVWYLQLFFFLMPIIGIGILAQGLAEFGLLFFNRRGRGKEWEMAVASTFNNHTVLVGLGHLGYRVARQLHELDEEVVAITLTTTADTKAQTQAMQIPLIEEDGNRESVLQAAGVAKAKAIVICTQNDGLNLQVALKARSLNPDIRVVVRIFDSYFADSLEQTFGFHALSATQMAAPAFATAAAGVNITRPLTIEGAALSLASVEVVAHSGLIGLSLETVEQTFDISVVLLRRNGESDFHPASDRKLLSGDTIAILGGPTQINQLVNSNQ
jgi:Trk K+ transport system NAD-binding subunit